MHKEMQIDYFLITERIKQIETTFIKDGWLTIYELTKDDFIYCCLVLDSKIGEYKTKTDWKIRPYAEGKPTIDSDGAYKTYSEDGYEPFIFAKHFKLNNGHEEYLDISEEFILYFKPFSIAIAFKGTFPLLISFRLSFLYLLWITNVLNSFVT